MANWRELRDASGVRYLLDIARDDGISAKVCLADTALTESILFEPGTSIETWQELAVIRNLVRYGVQPDFGYRAGRRYHLTSIGLLGFTMLASENLLNALAVLDRFQSLALAICPVTTEPDEEGLWVMFDDRVLPADAKSLVIERGISAVINLVSELSQRQVHPAVVQVAHAAPTPASHQSTTQPYAIQYSAKRNGVLFAAQDLDIPLPQASLRSRLEGEQLCRRMIDELSLTPSRSPTVNRVQKALMNDVSTLLTSKQVAVRLGMSERTLHRRLAADGKTFAMLNDSIKKKIAERLLAESNIGVAEVAQQIGYAEAASFSRAFLRWTGTSPGRWRLLNAVEE